MILLSGSDLTNIHSTLIIGLSFHLLKHVGRSVLFHLTYLHFQAT